MKKKAIAVLLVLMMAISLVGCSPAEIGYLNLSKEVAQMDGIKVDETMVINYTGDELRELTGLNVGNYLEVRATGFMDEKSLAYDLELSYRLDKTSAYQPLTRIVMNQDTMLMSTEGIWKLVTQFGSEQFSPEFITDMSAYIAAHPFMKVSMDEELSSAQTVAYDQIMDQTVKMLDLLVKYHDGFSTGLITEKDGGYAVYADADTLIAMVDGWLDYAQKDIDNSYGMIQAFVAYAEELAGESLGMEMTKTEWQEGLKEVVHEWQSVKTELKDMKLSDKDYYEAYTKMTGDKGSRVLTAEENLNIEELGFNMKVTAKSTEQKVNINVGLNATDIEEYAAGIQAIVDRYTVVTGAELKPMDEAKAAIVTNMTFCGHPSNSVGYADLKYIDQKYSMGAADVPSILPGVGAVIDGTKVTLSYKGKTAEVTGVMSENMVGKQEVFIPVRDLTKVGVEISYTTNPEVLTLTLQQ